MKMDVVKYPDPILNTMCVDADLTKVETHQLALDMAYKLISVGGKSLAAPQVGQSIRLFVMKYGFTLIICVNPEITRRGRDKVTNIEKCLSIPGKVSRVTRSMICDLEFTELSGTHRKLKLRGIDARCAQHELDHLNGILIV